MSKKNQVKKYCQTCKTKTVHEIRTEGENEAVVCLRCESEARRLENSGYKSAKFGNEQMRGRDAMIDEANINTHMSI